MKLKTVRFEGVKVISLDFNEDHRGYFMRTFDKFFFNDNNIPSNFVQGNESYTRKKNTIRGLHFQLPPFGETKIVRVSQGSILDVFVDLRADSQTFGEWDSIELSSSNKKILCLPKGFAHGFCTLTDDCKVNYLVDSAYNYDNECGISWNDKELNIDWPTKNPVISDKDNSLMTLSFFKDNYGGI